jgi:hypothetical protein
MRCMPSVKGRHTSEARIGVHIPTFAYPYIRMHACMHAPPPYSFPPERGTVRVCGGCVCGWVGACVCGGGGGGREMHAKNRMCVAPRCKKKR